MGTTQSVATRYYHARRPISAAMDATLGRMVRLAMDEVEAQLGAQH